MGLESVSVGAGVIRGATVTVSTKSWRDNPTWVANVEYARAIDCQHIAERLLNEPGRQSGKSVRYRSPLRDGDNDPSFHVYSDGFKDFGNGASGDGIALVMAILNIPFRDAVHWLCDQFGGGVEIPTPLPSHPRNHESTSEIPSAVWQASAESGIATAEHILWSDTAEARRVRWYLHEVRGLSDETIRAARLGYNPSNKISITVNGVKRSVAPGILIPWYLDGQLHAVRIRCRVGNLAEALGIPPDKVSIPDENHRFHWTKRDKYGCVPGSKPSLGLYGIDQIDAALPVILIEGELDVLLGNQITRHLATFATRGSASASRVPANIAERLTRAPLVVACLDNDKAGQAGVQVLKASLGERLQIATLPSGNDLTEFVVVERGALTDWVQSTIAPTPVNTVTVPNLLYPIDLPDSWELALKTFRVRAVLIIVLRALLRVVASGEINPDDWTAGELIKPVAQFGITPASVYTALEMPEATVFFRSLPGHEGDFHTNEIVQDANFNGGEHGAHANSRKKAGQGRPAVHYRLRSVEDCIAGLLQQIVRPRLIERSCSMEVKGSPIAAVSDELVGALGITDPSDVVSVSANLDGIYTPNDNDAHHRIDREYDNVARALNNRKCTPLPVNYPWHNESTYNTALVARYLAAHPGQQLAKSQIAADTGLSIRTIAACVTRAGFIGDPQYVTQTLNSILKMPPPEYSTEYEGMPERIIFINPRNGVERPESMHSPDLYTVARKLLNRGWDATVYYRQPSIYRPMSDVEHQAAVVKEVIRKRKAALRLQMKKTVGQHVKPNAPTPTIMASYIGHNPAYVLGWAIRVLTLRGQITTDSDKPSQLSLGAIRDLLLGGRASGDPVPSLTTNDVDSLRIGPMHQPSLPLAGEVWRPVVYA